MNSRVHPKYKARYRVTNWASNEKALVLRGDFTLWITPAASKLGSQRHPIDVEHRESTQTSPLKRR